MNNKKFKFPFKGLSLNEVDYILDKINTETIYKTRSVPSNVFFNILYKLPGR